LKSFIAKHPVFGVRIIREQKRITGKITGNFAGNRIFYLKDVYETLVFLISYVLSLFFL